MLEKVNPAHVDKIADRIAGAMTDLVYSIQDNPNVSINVNINNGKFTIISESSYRFLAAEVFDIIEKITGRNDIQLELTCYPPNQFDIINQGGTKKCGNTGVYTAKPVSPEQEKLRDVVETFYNHYKTPGEYLASKNRVIVLQSLGDYETIYNSLKPEYHNIVVNPACDNWASTVMLDSGRSNNRSYSDLATISKGIHGKDLGKADITLQIYAWLKAQETKKPQEIFCAIGDEIVDGKFYYEIVEQVREYIDNMGGFEKLAEWGLF